MEGKSVIIRWGGFGLVLGQELGDDDGESDDAEGDEEGSQAPLQGLAAARNAPKVHVLLALLLPLVFGSQQPAPMRLVQLIMKPMAMPMGVTVTQQRCFVHPLI